MDSLNPVHAPIDLSSNAISISQNLPQNISLVNGWELALPWESLLGGGPGLSPQIFTVYNAKDGGLPQPCATINSGLQRDANELEVFSLGRSILGLAV